MPRFPIKLFRDPSGRSAGVLSADDPAAVNHLLRSERGTLIIPISDAPPEGLVVSRMLSKIAVEALAERLMRTPGGVAYLVDEKQFDPVRYHAREGRPQTWPHHARRIYAADRLFVDEKNETVQTVYEYDFLYTPARELYFVIALFGLELTINVGGPEIDGYLKWLKDHGDVSPLYSGGGPGKREP